MIRYTLLGASLAVLAACVTTSDEEMTREAVGNLSVDLDSLKSPTRCASGTVTDGRRRELFRDEVFGQRFIWSELNANDSDVLIALDKDCFERLNQVPPVPICRGEKIRRGGRICTVEEVYLVKDDRQARAAAVLHLLREARAAGRDDLPADNVAAAMVLLDEAAR